MSHYREGQQVKIAYACWEIHAEVLSGHRLPNDGVRDEVLSFLIKNVGSACER
jgi:hypothetical protein